MADVVLERSYHGYHIQLIHMVRASLIPINMVRASSTAYMDSDGQYGVLEHLIFF